MWHPLRCALPAPPLTLPSTLSILLSVFPSLSPKPKLSRQSWQRSESESVNRRLLLPAAAQSVRSLTVSRGDLCLRLAQLRPRLLQSCSKFASFGCFGAHAAHTGARVSLTHSLTRPFTRCLCHTGRLRFFPILNVRIKFSNNNV